ncbi:MAG: porin [Hydrogenophaga sp.]|uniref:porin n=1 Tax=Hydrogenophaga sp. TaxID=1904254 RepID=UPI00272348E2|nr:porin [Hydrogenophaga sp.]MDO9148793.1 porin [Hydrogenophaga sp.]MDO9603777.1 porin [Hydrogenophaga sp.]
MHPNIMKNALKLFPLSAFVLLSGHVQAQSSLTLFGKVDAGLVRAIGTGTTTLGEGAQSRVGLRGTEDLGQGMKVSFWLENRFRSTTGALTAVRYFQGQSIVAIEGGWGKLSLGRDYVAGYTEVQITPDPFIHTGVSSFVSVGTGGIGTVRNDGTITYKNQLGAFGFALQTASAVNPNSTTLPASSTIDRPVNGYISYQAGPVYLGWSHENPGGANDSWNFIAARYVLDRWTLTAGFGSGKDNVNNKRKSAMLGAAFKTTAGRVKLSYGQLENTTTHTDLTKKFAIGYNHDLSKRTFLYANLAHDKAVATNRSGFDLGLQHNF